MKELVFLLEEPSAQEMLKIVVGKLIHDDRLSFKYVVFDGRSNLDKNLKRKIRDYQIPNAEFIILRDQDGGDCKKLKDSLTKKIPAQESCRTTVRIACRELESFYLGDLEAVAEAL